MSQQQQQPTVQPSLADLDKPVETPAETPKETSTSTEEEKKDDLTNNPTNTPKTEEKPPVTEEKKPEETSEEITTDTEEEVTPEAFWGAVSQLRGDNFKFEFPSEIEDPLTPAAVHHAIRLAEESAVEQFEQTLAQADKRAYSYMLHRANGGSDEEFFANKTEVLPDLEALKGSVDLQQAFYKRTLGRKGVDPEDADLIIKNAIEKNKLFTLVEAEHKSADALQKKQLEDLTRINEVNRQREEQIVNRMATVLQERILQNKGLDITIPDTKRAEFLQFVNNSLLLDRETGRWYVNQEFNQDNMSSILQALYYMHVGGNMDEIISNKAKQKVVQGVKLRMQSDKTKKTSSPDPNKRTNEKQGVNLPLSEL